MCTRHTGLFSVLTLIISMMFPLLAVAAPSEPSRFNAPKRYLYVQPGQTVGSIVKTLYPDEEALWLDIAKRLVIINPHAFENGNVNKMIVGARIEIPPAREETYASRKKILKPEVVGSVLVSRGKIFAIYTDKKRRELKAGNDIYAGDRLYTGMDGFMRMKMIDDASIELRCNSEMLIESYKMVPEGNTSVIHLLKGSLHKVTGKIGKNITDRYEMRTPVATVGVRGTEYALRVTQSHGCDGSVDVNSDGMFIKVDKGEIDVSNSAGDTSLVPGTSLLVATNKARPQKVVLKDGVFEAVKARPVAPPPPAPAAKEPEPAPPPPPPVEKEEGTSWWWIVLGVLIVAAL